MPYKDPEKHREQQRQWRKKNPNYMTEWKKKKNPNYKSRRDRRDAHYDFETHHQLAINSGIRTEREWYECHKIGLFPDGIYQNPNTAFRRK